MGFLNIFKIFLDNVSITNNLATSYELLQILDYLIM